MRTKKSTKVKGKEKRRKRKKKEQKTLLVSVPVSDGWNGCGSIHPVRKPGMGPVARVRVAPCWGMGSCNGPVPVGLSRSRGSMWHPARGWAHIVSTVPWDYPWPAVTSLSAGELLSCNGPAPVGLSHSRWSMWHLAGGWAHVMSMVPMGLSMTSCDIIVCRGAL